MIGALSGMGTYSPWSYPAAAARMQPQTAQAAANLTRTVAIPPAQPELPVQPVPAVKSAPVVEAAFPDAAEFVFRLENDPAAAIMRGRIQYLDGPQNGAQGTAASGGQTAAASAPGAQNSENILRGAAQPSDAEKTASEQLLPGLKDDAPAGPEKDVPELPDGEKSKTAQEVFEEGECQTCKNRKYQDGSDDMGVSFQTPTHISPENAASRVRGHEYEHVTREQAKADREDREVVSQSVTYKTDICPECGRVYVSGGETRTVTRDSSDPPAAEAQKDADEDEAAA